MGTEQIVILCMAVGNCIYDCIRREILLLPTSCILIFGIVYGIANDQGVLFFLIGLIPGVCMAVLSFVSRQAVGLGDAVVIAVIGVWCGCGAAFVTLFTAFLVQSVISAVYRFSGGRKKELPFLPAVFTGYLFSLLLV